MLWWRKLLTWCKDHWLPITIVVVVGTCSGLTIYGMSKLESFYRNMQLATMPMWILVWLLIGVVNALVYVSIIFGYFSKQKTKKIAGEKVDVRFDDVLGMEEAKTEAWEVVQLLKDHARLKKVGGKILRGVMMQGPPGCGKTYLAKAIATEAGVPFLSLAASDFVEVFVGVGAARVRKLFQEARKLSWSSGAAIIFIDELDAIGRTRSFAMHGGQETNSTLNSLLVEMDGIQNEKENVVVIGATNAPESEMDSALLRPGRFDRKIFVDRPSLKGREQIFEFYLKKVQAKGTMDVGRLARRAVGKSPAEIENIVKEAALIATRKGQDEITYEDISEAIERIDLGIKHQMNMTDHERRATAYHEAGHLIANYLLHPHNDVFKASIIPRRGALGVVYPVPREELHSKDKEHMLADIKTALAGYVAEKVSMGSTTSGVSSDFQKATLIAHAMVWCVGMGEDYLGDFTAIPENQLSEEMKTELNRRTNDLLKQCANEVEELLTKERKILDRFAEELVKREELEFDDINEIFAEFGKTKDDALALLGDFHKNGNSPSS